jgi:hypothetical protein
MVERKCVADNWAIQKLVENCVIKEQKLFLDKSSNPELYLEGAGEGGDKSESEGVDGG